MDPEQPLVPATPVPARPRVAGRAAGLADRIAATRPLRRPIPDRRRRAWIAAAGAGALVAGLVVALLVWAAPAAVLAVDAPVGRVLHELALAHPLLGEWARAWSWLADGPRNVAIVAVASTLLVVARAWPWAVFLVVVTQLGVLLSNVLKVGIGRARPGLVEQASGQATLSFPSGHSFAGMTVWGSLALVSLYLLPRPWGRAAAGGCLAIGLLQPLARLLLARHWLTDVTGGLLLGLGWFLLSWACFATILDRRADRAPRQPPTDG